MARPKKKGLDYFPLDVDIFEDDKLFDVQNDYGPLGEIIYIRLLCLVYKNGYYYQFENLDKLAAMVIRSIGNRWAKDKKTVKEVILYLAKINLFSAELMHRNVITSRSIQERYLLAVERRQSKIEEYNLLENSEYHEGLLNAPKNPVTVAESRINAAETSDNVSDNPTKESKVKKSKINESKADEITTELSEKNAETVESFGEHKLVKLTEKQYGSLCSDYGKEIITEYITKMDGWMFEKQKAVFKDDFDITLRKWLSRDNIGKIKDMSKYDFVINAI